MSASCELCEWPTFILKAIRSKVNLKRGMFDPQSYLEILPASCLMCAFFPPLYNVL